MKEFNKFIQALEKCLTHRDAFIAVLSNASECYGSTLSAQYAFDHWITYILGNNKNLDTYLAYETLNNAAGQLAEFNRCEQEGIDLFVDCAGGDKLNPMLRETFTALLHKKLHLHGQIPPELREDIALVDKLGEAILSMESGGGSQQIRQTYYQLLEHYYDIEQKISRCMGVKEAETILIALAMVKAETRRIIETVREDFRQRDARKLAKAEEKSRNLGKRVQQATRDIVPVTIISDASGSRKHLEIEVIEHTNKPLSGKISVITAFGMPLTFGGHILPQSRHKLH